ncbi:unnamed protein product [Trichobilharzia regenti]|nr:unnamed protein product [Trichobilharzia regenti]
MSRSISILSTLCIVLLCVMVNCAHVPYDYINERNLYPMSEFDSEAYYLPPAYREIAAQKYFKRRSYMTPRLGK